MVVDDASLEQQILEADAQYMHELGLPTVIDGILHRILKKRPGTVADVWREIGAASREALGSVTEQGKLELIDSTFDQAASGNYSETQFVSLFEENSPRAVGHAVLRAVKKQKMHVESMQRRCFAAMDKLSPSEMYAFLAEELREALYVKTHCFFLLDEDNRMLFDPSCPEKRCRLGVGAVGAAARERQPSFNVLTRTDVMFSDSDGTYAAVCPVCSWNASSVLAVLVVSRDEMFEVADQFALNEFRARAADIFVHQQLKEQLQGANNQVSVLLEVAHRLSSELEVDSLIRTIMAVSRDLLQADRSTLFLVDNETDELLSKVAEGTTEIRIPKTAGIAGTVATTGEMLSIPDAYADPRFNKAIDQQTGYKTNSVLCMPMMNRQGDVIGVTQMINKKNGSPFNKSDSRLLAAFSAQAAVAIENSLLFKETAESKDLFSNVLSSIKALILTLDQKGKLLTTNHDPQKWGIELKEGYMRRHPYTEWFRLRQEEKGRSKSEDQRLGGSNPKRAPHEAYVNGLLRESIKECYSSGKDTYIAEFSLELPESKGRMTINFTTMALRSYDGDQRGVVVLMEDISHEKQMLATLGKYLSPELAAEALQGGGTQLGGQQLPVTVLFVDIRSFTSLTETMKATEVVDTLNQYFGLMGGAVLEFGGIVDKYIGDAVMAVYGVPFSSPEDDPVAACSSALMMIHRLKKWNKERVAGGLRPIGMGIGINSGEVVAGNIGFEKRMEYTVIGDGVNLASRVEGATKEYGVQILITEDTFEMILGMGLVVREVDVIRVVGKLKPVRLFELQGDQGLFPVSEAQLAINERFSKGLQLYRNRCWKAALELFEQSPSDGPSVTFAKRCSAYARGLRASPSETWDGVWEMTTK